MKTKNQQIVILHGWGLSGDTFGPLSDELNKLGYRVFTPDFPGFGKEPPPQYPWSIDEYARFLDYFLERNKIRHPVLVGHSFGGRVALKYQELYPKKLTCLVLTGTPGFTPIPKKRLLFFIALAKIGKLLFRLPPMNIFQDSIRRWYYYVAGARDYFRAEGIMREIFKKVVQQELVSAMESVSCPCLLVWGELDIIVPVTIAHRMEHIISGANLFIIPEADHGLPYKKPKEFAWYVNRFLLSL